jgi:ribosomal protein L7/L12
LTGGCYLFFSWSVIAISIVRKLRAGRPADEPDRSPLQPPAGIPDDVIELVRHGKKIQAIKRYRKLNSDLGLKQAKEHIDLISLATKPDNSPRS